MFFQIKGIAYEGDSGSCKFKVNLYQGPGSDILCEFQRRSGCTVSFNRFYRRTIAEPPLRIFGDWLKVVDLLEQKAIEEEICMDHDTAENLITMAGCKDIKSQREGAHVLTIAARSTVTREQLARMDTIVPLIRLVRHL